MTPAGRPRSFDESTVLDRAAEVFWRAGYDGTSVAMLTEATGLAKGSLYKAFGDKRGLWHAVLERYLRTGESDVAGLLDGGGPPLDRLAAWLCSMAGRCDCSDGSPGCLAANAMVELEPDDAVSAELLEAHFDRVAGRVASVIAEGQQRGELRTDRPAELEADLLMLVVVGIHASARRGLGADRARAAATLALEGLRNRTEPRAGPT